jgi:hypothetical protein
LRSRNQNLPDSVPILKGKIQPGVVQSRRFWLQNSESYGFLG